ncbi:ribosome-inactivating family protein [Micromonospora sp. NPDC004704]
MLAWIASLVTMAAFLVAVHPAPANADPSNPHTIINWDVSDLDDDTNYGRQMAAQDYVNMITSLRRVAGHDLVNRVGETTDRGQRVIEIRVLRNGAHNLSIYLWARSLYVIGFWARTTPGQVGHRFFNDPAVNGAAGILGIPQPPRLPWTGNYATTPGGSYREDMRYTAKHLNDAIYTLEGMPAQLNGSNPQRTHLAQEMIRLIGAVAEAARFGAIENFVYHRIRDRGDIGLGTENRELENNWARLSDWILDIVDNPTTAPVYLLGRYFYTVAGLVEVLHYLMIRNPSTK